MADNFFTYLYDFFTFLQFFTTGFTFTIYITCVIIYVYVIYVTLVIERVASTPWKQKRGRFTMTRVPRLCCSIQEAKTRGQWTVKPGTYEQAGI